MFSYNDEDKAFLEAVHEKEMDTFVSPFMQDLLNRFDNWVSWQTQEWRDDSGGESFSDFSSRMEENRKTVFVHPYEWREALENFEEADF